jgi:hypothetical protein
MIAEELLEKLNDISFRYVYILWNDLEKLVVIAYKAGNRNRSINR